MSLLYEHLMKGSIQPTGLQKNHQILYIYCVNACVMEFTCYVSTFANSILYRSYFRDRVSKILFNYKKSIVEVDQFCVRNL